MRLALLGAPTDAAPADTSAELPVSMTITSADAELDELLVSLDVLPSSAPSDLPISLIVQDAGDTFVVTADIVGEDFEDLVTAPYQRPVATFED